MNERISMSEREGGEERVRRITRVRKREKASERAIA